MEKLRNDLLEEFEVISILVGFILGVGVLGLPNAVVKDAKQDAVISILIGALHPLFFALLAIYYVKKHPNENILLLSEKYLGKIVGSIFNIIHMITYGVYMVIVLNGLKNVFVVYATEFLTPLKIFIPSVFAAMYLSNKEIKVLARINKIALLFSITLMFMLIPAVMKGQYLNLLPILSVGYKEIFKSSMESAYAFGGMEVIFLIYPIIRTKERVKNMTLKGCLVVTMIYCWVTFISIYYLGYKVTSKSTWPILLVTEGINLPIINSFRLVFLFLWSIVIIKLLANEYYAFTYILKHVFKIKHKNKINYIAYPIIIYLCLKIENQVSRVHVIDILIPKITLFNIFYVAIIGTFIFINDKMKRKTL